MGTYCSHQHTTEPVVLYEFISNLFWRYQVTICSCKDCPKTDIRRIRKLGRLTGLVYSTEDVSQKTCKHEHFLVDENTQLKAVEDAGIASCMVGLMLGPSWGADLWKHRFLMAEATCRTCDFRFYVRAEMDKEWSNQDIQEKRTTPWIPVKKQVAEESTPRYREEYVQVESKK